MKEWLSSFTGSLCSMKYTSSGPTPAGAGVTEPSGIADHALWLSRKNEASLSPQNWRGETSRKRLASLPVVVVLMLSLSHECGKPCLTGCQASRRPLGWPSMTKKGLLMGAVVLTKPLQYCTPVKVQITFSARERLLLRAFDLMRSSEPESSRSCSTQPITAAGEWQRLGAQVSLDQSRSTNQAKRVEHSTVLVCMVPHVTCQVLDGCLATAKCWAEPALCEHTVHKKARAAKGSLCTSAQYSNYRYRYAVQYYYSLADFCSQLPAARTWAAYFPGRGFEASLTSTSFMSQMHWSALCLQANSSWLSMGRIASIGRDFTSQRSCA